MGEARIRAARPHRDVAIAYCRPEDVDGAFADALMLLLLWDSKHDRRVDATIGVEGGARVHLARNEIVRRFLAKTSCEWLMWFDADMVPPADCIDRLLEVADPEEKPIVGALCFAGGKLTIKPTIYEFKQDENGDLTSDCWLQYPANSLVECHGTGSACVLIHRSVFEAIEAEPSFGLSPHPWYQDQIICGQDWSEDLVFCLRAKTVGKKIWVHTGVQVGHRKKRVLDQEVFTDWVARAEAERPDVMVPADGQERVLSPEELADLKVRI